VLLPGFCAAAPSLVALERGIERDRAFPYFDVAGHWREASPPRTGSSESIIRAGCERVRRPVTRPG